MIFIMSRDREYTTANLVSDSKNHHVVFQGLPHNMSQGEAIKMLEELAIPLYPPRSDDNYFKGDDFPRSVRRADNGRIIGVLHITHNGEPFREIHEIDLKYTLELLLEGRTMLEGRIEK